MPIELCILGVTGKMGQSLLRLAGQDPRFCITGASVREDSCWVGKNLGELLKGAPPHVTIEGSILCALHPCAIAIDFTHASATDHHIRAALELGKPLVIGTTALTEKILKEVSRAAEQIPILLAPNFSVGVSLCLDIVKHFSKALMGQYQIAITETHHTHKKDSPSGTALALALAAGDEKIPIQSFRIGDTIGEHSIVFESAHEKIELTHQALSRDVFARGALLAAEFLVKQPPGLYSLKDILRIE
jgi:4-hydroxy-tetrahydrodipicolinate reductase